MKDRASDNPLLSAILYLSQKENRKVSKQQILTGLPIDGENLTLDAFQRAAYRAGFSAKFYAMALDQITDTTNPKILLLKDHKLTILEGFTEAGRAQFIDPIKQTTYETSLDEANQHYTGQLIEMIPIYYDEADIDYTKKRPTKQLFKEALKHHQTTYSHVIVSSILVNMFVFVTPLFLMLVYDRVVPNASYNTLWALAIGAFTFFVFDFILRMIRTYFIDLISSDVDETLSTRLYNHLVNVKMANKPFSIGSFVNLFREFEMLRDFITSATLISLIDLPFILLFLVGIALIAGPLVFLPIGGIIVIILITLVAEYRTRQSVHKNLRASTHKNALLIETLASLEAIKSLNLQNTFQRRWLNGLRSSGAASSKTSMFTAIASNLTTLIQQVVTISVGIWGAYHIIEGTMTVGALIAVTILTSRATMVNQVISLITRYERAKAGMRSLNQVLNLPKEIQEDKTYIEALDIQGEIKFTNVSFTYPDRTLPVFDHINLKITAGEKVGVLGAIGSGKTTMLKLIAGLYGPTSGLIEIDGITNSEIHPTELRKQVYLLTREQTLFYGSIRENIYLGNPKATDEAFIRAVKTAGVEYFTRRHPLGYDMPVGESGELLSSGQRQAILLARALIAEPSVYLLDEPTADLDTQLEQAFIDKAGESFNDKTVIITTHRYALLELVDRLIVIGNQKVIADGAKDEVLKLITKPSQGNSNKGHG